MSGFLHSGHKKFLERDACCGAFFLDAIETRSTATRTAKSIFRYRTSFAGNDFILLIEMPMTIKSIKRNKNYYSGVNWKKD